MIEEFARNYSNTIAATSAAATWAAVVVALWIAQQSSKPKLKAYVDKTIHVPSEAQRGRIVDQSLCEDVITVTLQNKGAVTTYISYWAFMWRFPWRSISALQNPYSPDFRSEPIKLEPGQSVSIILTKDLEMHRETLKGLCKKNKLPEFLKRFIILRVVSQDGRGFTGDFGKSYKKEFLS
jgi:hypothetical protein